MQSVIVPGFTTLVGAHAAAFKWAKLISARVRILNDPDYGLEYLVNTTPKQFPDRPITMLSLLGEQMLIMHHDRGVMVEVEVAGYGLGSAVEYSPQRITLTDFELMCDDRGVPINEPNLMIGLHQCVFEGNGLRTLLAKLAPIARGSADLHLPPTISA